MSLPASENESDRQLLDLSTHPLPRFVLYAQTHHTPAGDPLSLLPLLTNRTGVTHVIIAAIHLNDGPGNITLNDDPPDAQKFEQLWREARTLQESGVKVMGMLGGAAKGSYWRLQGTDEEFEAYYTPLRDLIRHRALDGLDLDVEEEISLATLVRLLTRLRADFGPEFITTLAPVATALLVDPRLPFDTYTPPASPGAPLILPRSMPHLSGFSHFALEAGHGALVSWYHAQFYNGWGDAGNTRFYDAILAAGWPAHKIVLGVLTNAGNGGSGYVAPRVLEGLLQVLRARRPGTSASAGAFGGVMGWEYFNAGASDEEVQAAGGEGGELPRSSRPWEWAQRIGRCVRRVAPPTDVAVEVGGGGRGGPLPDTAVPWPSSDVQSLLDLGFGRANVVQALNATNGNVELAASLLFEM